MRIQNPGRFMLFVLVLTVCISCNKKEMDPKHMDPENIKVLSIYITPWFVNSEANNLDPNEFKSRTTRIRYDFTDTATLASFSEAMRIYLSPTKEEVLMCSKIEILCELLLENDSLFHISLCSRNMSYVLIEDRLYETRPELYSFVIGLLPKDYERWRRGRKMINYWEKFKKYGLEIDTISIDSY